MDSSEPVINKIEPVSDMDDCDIESNNKVSDIEGKCSKENAVSPQHNLQADDDNNPSLNEEDSNKIERNTIRTLDHVSYNRKRARERSRKLTRLLQEHQRLLRRTFSQGMKQIKECKSLSDFSDEKYALVVSNFPKFWNCGDIKRYIEAESGNQIDEIQLIENCGLYGVAKLPFYSFEEAKQIMDKLYDNEVEGIKLCTELKVVNDEDDNQNKLDSKTKADLKLKADAPQWRPELDVWGIDPEGLYGLKPEFLKSLGIEPPIDKWVQVTNFRCEKSELRDVMELAGQVLMCSVTNFTTRRAKVMYSHPLEAVQAISMLNGQSFYGMPLKLEMDINPDDNVLLPKGLTAIGMGLGSQGRPIRNIVRHYKRHIKGASSSINRSLFSDVKTNNEYIKRCAKAQKIEVSDEKAFAPASIETRNVTELFNNEQNSSDSNEINVANVTTSVRIEPNTASKLSNSDSPSIPDVLYSVNRNVPSSQITSSRPISSALIGTGKSAPLGSSNFIQIPLVPNIQRHAYRPVQVGLIANAQIANVIRPGLNGSGLNCHPRPSPPNMALNLGSFTVQLSNLPLNTTFPFLYEKLSVCGQVVSLQFTTPGCAVATFTNKLQAERCLHQFNMLNVEGYIINAKLI